MSQTLTTRQIAEAVGGRLSGNADHVVMRLAHPADILGDGDLALAMDPKLLPLLADGKARAAIVGKDADTTAMNLDCCIAVDRPRLAMAKLTNLFARPVPVVTGIHPSAVIEEGAKIGANVTIGAMSFVGTGAVIGDNTVIHPQTYVAPHAQIGRDGLVHAGARIGAHVHIGDRCIIHFNASIGADGFSFVTPQPGSVEQAKASNDSEIQAANHELIRIASLGSVILGDDVEIGANTSIDRGTIASTRIGKGTKIDNQVQVGHNVVIGENCLICGRVGIAGSVTIGDRVVLGGAVGVADHLKIGDDAVCMAMAGIAGNVLPRTVVGGIPASPRNILVETYFNISRLKKFFKKIDILAERLDQLEKK